MDYKKELESLLETIKETHLDTVHRLSELYNQAENTIKSLMDSKGEKEIEEGLLYIKKILSDAADIRAFEVDGIRDYMNKFFIDIVENIPSKAKKGGVGAAANAFQIKEEDAKKITDIAASNMQTMLGVFTRVGEIFANHFGDKDKKTS